MELYSTPLIRFNSLMCRRRVFLSLIKYLFTVNKTTQAHRSTVLSLPLSVNRPISFNGNKIFPWCRCRVVPVSCRVSKCEPTLIRYPIQSAASAVQVMSSGRTRPSSKCDRMAYSPKQTTLRLLVFRFEEMIYFVFSSLEQGLNQHLNLKHFARQHTTASECAPGARRPIVVMQIRCRDLGRTEEEVAYNQYTTWADFPQGALITLQSDFLF